MNLKTLVTIQTDTNITFVGPHVCFQNEFFNSANFICNNTILILSML